MLGFRNLLTIAVLLLSFACGGKLSEKERAALREEMNQREIRQVRDEDIVNHALEIGRSLREDTTAGRLETIGAKKEIFTARPGQEQLANIWDAYETTWEEGEDPGENIQRDYPDWLLYTYSKYSDGRWSMVLIRIPRKGVILSLESQ
ncbi:MAG: hypothetical protein P8X57_01320 [Cyclobacteriaceae bacterium]